MSDQFREVSSRGWGGRLVDSIKGVIFGIILLLGSFVLLWWNEGRAVRTAESLDEGASIVVSVPADKVEGANEGKLVHVLGNAVTEETLSDPAFGVSTKALRLVRHVDMYQWKEEKKSETRKKLGGGEETVTTYSYTKQWSDHVNSSSSFKEPAGHTNPTRMPYEQLDQYARNAKLGAFHLPQEVLSKISDTKKLPVDTNMAAALPGNLAGKAKPVEGAWYVGADAASPQVGDARVSYEVLPPGVISLVAQQSANSFRAYKAKAGDDVLLVETGSHDAKQMFKSAQDANTALTWILRGVGWFVMALGMFLILRPIAVVADFIPMIGSLVGAGAFLFAAVLSFGLSLLTIAIAWIAVRPLLGISVLVVALLGFGAALALALKARKRRRAHA
jgi:hypothetical protein